MTAFFTAVGVVVFAVPFLLVLSIAGVAWRSWWLYPAWAWYLVPLGLPAIKFWHFAALLLLTDTVFRHVDSRKDDRKVEWVTLSMSFLWPAFAWWLLRWMR